MRISLSGCCKQAQPRLNFPAGGIMGMESFTPRWRKEKVVIVMGATGTGKSKLSIDLATRFNAEIVNSDKMQVYRGLDIVTNKVTEEEQCGVTHHLLGVVDSDDDFTASDFRRRASREVELIADRRKLPIIAGGSNSYIEALVDDDDHEFRSKYDCCFLWVDVSLPVLHSFVSDRVDQMVEAGLVDEVRKMFDPNADYTRGVRRAIGVPEMDRYLRAEDTIDDEARARLLEGAIDEIKANTCRLACCQLEKIHRLRTLSGWDIHRLDATDAFRIRGSSGAEEAWDKLVVGPAATIVRRFLYENNESTPALAVALIPIKTAVAAVGR
ncbi:adenylate isopentenyltransferase 3, chloroplastic-like [Magnolia sinica]|uniref:adenylate isopentenyltransferase 3, chloroplastic-like n=1 Tax=Magnolia sinica TaxID=86752 RepID=UPI002657C786|nr:adenylate isopentenyltransferase 3, chloroplastic-like [Magnolia sinica]